jgi:hypothetical protein
MLVKSYSLDSKSTLKIIGLELVDTYSTLLVCKEQIHRQTIEESYHLVRKILFVLDSSSSKGFLTSTDLRYYPFLSELLPSFITGSEEEYIDYICGNKSMESYK